MTQPASHLDPVAERAWSRIGHDDWSQLKWFVALANTTGFAALSEGERLVWQEDFFVMLQQTPLLPSEPPRTKRPSRPSENHRATFAQWQEHGMLPTAEVMQQIRDAIATHLERLADGEGTSLGPFDVTLSTTYVPDPEHRKDPNLPRYAVRQGEVWTGRASHPFQRSLLFLMDSLLKTHGYADKLRRCPHCERIFLQLKRSATYCGPKCYTVAGMRALRERRRSEREQTEQERRQHELRDVKRKRETVKKGWKPSAKRRSRHGAKGR